LKSLQEQSENKALEPLHKIPIGVSADKLCYRSCIVWRVSPQIARTAQL